MFKNFFPNKIISLTNKTINSLIVLLIVVVIFGLLSRKMDTILGLSPTADNDPQYTLLEQHCYLEIEEDYALPYIVTVEEQSQQILCIRIRLAANKYRENHPYTKIHFFH